jgi:hypothetical protein
LFANNAGSGLPAYHPWVINLGLDPAMVDRLLREDAARIVNMGYNLKGDKSPECRNVSVLIISGSRRRWPRGGL